VLPSRTPEQQLLLSDVDPSTNPTLERADILEEALLDLFGGQEATNGDGRYIHHVTHNIDSHALSVKAIAFYKPHSSYNCYRSGVLANWTSVSTAIPRYLGQYQPHVPDALGYYDLRLHDVLRRQVELARQYGIYGFCFRFDTLSEIRTHDLPLAQLISDSTLEIAFCISCEDSVGQDPQVAKRESQDALLPLLSEIFADRRYIRIGGKPMLVLSGALGVSTVQGWRQKAQLIGLTGFYLVARCESASTKSLIGFDAVIEDPTLGVDINAVSDMPLIDLNFRGDVYSYPEIMEKYSAPTESSHVDFRNVVVGWDTEPRTPSASRSFAGSTPALFARWLDRCCRHTLRQKPEERFIFVSSWNDWAAGAHLEPDHRFGYAYLNAMANVLRSYHRDESAEALVRSINRDFSPSSDTAIIFHCFHEDLINPIFDEYLSQVGKADLFVTAPVDISYHAIEEMKQRFPNIFFDIHENRGRDIRPFLFALRRIQSLGYTFGCKIHTKKTPHAGEGKGEMWRNTLMRTLLGASDGAEQVRRRFNNEADLGLLVPSGSLMELNELRHHIDNTFWLDRLLDRMNRKDLIDNYIFLFPAGSMFWFRVQALAGLDDLVLSDDAFEQELGQRDGTLAHAVERLIGLYAVQKGYQTHEINVATQVNSCTDESRLR
jgi:hypothetical protein